MAQTHDTIDGLLAEFRGYSAGMPASYHVTMSWADFRKMLNRFEAAHKRERGDCAKLREALCEILSYIESFHKYITPGKGEKLTALFAVADTIRNNARAALAAPPRNCDRFANAVEAMAELKRVHSYCAKENRRCLEDCPDCGKEWCSLAWLFALATESEAQA